MLEDDGAPLSEVRHHVEPDLAVPILGAPPDRGVGGHGEIFIAQVGDEAEEPVGEVGVLAQNPGERLGDEVLAGVAAFAGSVLAQGEEEVVVGHVLALR